MSKANLVSKIIGALNNSKNICPHHSYSNLSNASKGK